MNKTSHDSSVWPYVVIGSAIGGAIGYLFSTETGRKVRHNVTHPDELAGNIEDAGDYIQEKTRMVTDKIHGVFEKAKHSINEGERAYQQASERLRSRMDYRTTRNVTESAHNTVNKLGDMAETVQQSVFDPICDIAAIYRGIHRGVGTMFGKSNRPRRLGDNAANM
jgi:gas vesicle protein